MKKILVMILVVILVLSMQVCFATFPDIENSQYKTAIEYLSSISIVAGYEDNTYKPEKVVTRAEMAKFLVTAMKADVEEISSSSEFLDVPNWHWAVKYVNAAQKNELIKGDGDGNFRPDDTVNYGEALTMVVRMLGYDIDVEGTGIWPNNYIDRAKELGLIENVESFTNTQGANRGSIAQIIYNAINKVHTKDEYPLIKLVNKVFDMVNNKENAKYLYNDERNSLKANFSFNLDVNTNNEYIKEYLDDETKETIKTIENLLNNSQVDIQFKFDLIKEYAQYIIEYFFENEELLEVELNVDKNKLYVFIKDVFEKYLKSESETSFFDELFASNEMDEEKVKMMRIMEKSIFKKIMELDKNGKETTIKINGTSKDVTKFSFEIDDYDILDVQKYMYEEILNNDDLINTLYNYDYLTLEEKKELIREQIESLKISEYSSIKCKLDIYLQDENIVGVDVDYKETDSYWEETEESNIKITFRMDEDKYIEAKLVSNIEDNEFVLSCINKKINENKYNFTLDVNVSDFIEFGTKVDVELSKEDIVKPSFSASVEQLDEETQAKLKAKFEEIIERVGLKELYDAYMKQQEEMRQNMMKISFNNNLFDIRYDVLYKTYENDGQYKYTGVVDNPKNVENNINPDVIIQGINVWRISSNNTLYNDIENITDYGIDTEGNVYYIKGVIIAGNTYYNEDTFVEGIVSGAVKIEDY